MRGNPKFLSGAELERICAPTLLENGLGAAGCLGIAAALLFLFVAVFVSVFKPLFAWVALTAAALFWGRHLISLPKRAYREELAWRRGLASFSRYVDEARTDIVRSGADWIILFTMTSLPHGGSRWLRIALSGEPLARAQVRLLVSEQGQPRGQLERSLPDAALQDLLAMLGELDLAALTDMPSTVRDGAPCRLAIMRREPEASAQGSCNLAASLTDEERQHPMVAACLKLAGFARSLTPAQEGYKSKSN
jgi:hypothetical protein